MELVINIHILKTSNAWGILSWYKEWKLISTIERIIRAIIGVTIRMTVWMDKLFTDNCPFKPMSLLAFKIERKDNMIAKIIAINKKSLPKR